MRVKLCTRCPYLPCDLTGHYDPEGALHLCAKCDDQREATTKYYPRKAHWRQKCATFPNIVGTAQRNAARSVTESSVSSGTTPGEPPSVQRNALIASKPDRMATADGYFDLSSPPENGCGGHRAAIHHGSAFRDTEVAQ
jgi:hypothetical protein